MKLDFVLNAAVITASLY